MNKILIFTTTEGHLSIAQAIEEALRKKFDVRLILIHEPLLVYYRFFYRLFPKLLFISYNASFFSIFQTLAAIATEHFHYSKIVTEIEAFKPDVVINTSQGFNSALKKAKAQFHFIFINVLHDPRTIFPTNLSAVADLNLSFDEKTFYQEGTSVTPLGWFVRGTFEKPYDKAAVRKSLGIQPDHLVLLITSGSEGSLSVIKNIISFRNTDLQHVTFIIACGNNRILFKGVEALKMILKQRGSDSNIIGLGFVENMDQYMQAADIVVGKAGPNTLFESVATLTPFFAISHIPGQEDGNLDIIHDYNLGYVEENPLKAQTLLRDIIEQPHQLNIFAVDLKKMAEYNHQAKEKLVTLIEKLLAERS